MRAVLYIHGKGGSAAEADHYRPLFPSCDVIGLDYTGDTPWDCAAEFRREVAALKERYDGVLLIANSIGAYFSMHAFTRAEIERAWFISPIVDMERLILDLLRQTGESEQTLREKKTIETPFGETLSWDYLCFIRNRPILWLVPTQILYGDRDFLTSPDTIRAFAAAHRASLTVMPGGEHWFHTAEQMRFLDAWIAKTEDRY